MLARVTLPRFSPKKVLGRVGWPMFWLLLGIGIAWGLQAVVTYRIQLDLNNRGVLAAEMSQRWVDQLVAMIGPLVAEPQLNMAPTAEREAVMKQVLYEFAYLHGVDHVYFVERVNNDEGASFEVFYPFSTMDPGTEMTRLWRMFAQDLQDTPALNVLNISVADADVPFVLVTVPILVDEVGGIARFVAMLLPFGQAVAHHPTLDRHWQPLAQAFIFDESGEDAVMVGPIWQGDAHPGQLHTTRPVTSAQARLLRAQYGEVVGILGAGASYFQAFSLSPEGWRLLIFIPLSALSSQLWPWQVFIIVVSMLLAFYSSVRPILLARQRSMLAKRAIQMQQQKAQMKDYLDTRARYAMRAKGRKKYGARKPPVVQRVKTPEKKMMQTILESLQKKRTTLLFQPIFSTYEHHTPLMYEVLLRLHDDNGEIITPAQFVPIAQQFNLFPHIDAHVVVRVIEEYLQYNREHQMPLTVNLGPETFESATFLQALIQRIEPAWSKKLIFEVRSEDVIKNKQALNFMKQARQLGCQFSSDYFGGGEAMLSGAKRLKFNFVKLDAQKFQTPEKRKELVRLVKKAQNLGLQLVFERVEEKTDALLAQKIEIPFVQGYYFARPKEVM